MCGVLKKNGEMVKDFEGRDVRIKLIRALELLVPCLVHDFHDEVLAGHIRRFVERTVILPVFVFSFGLVEFCTRNVPINCVIV